MNPCLRGARGQPPESVFSLIPDLIDRFVLKDYDRDADPRNRNDREDDEFATGWQSVEIDTRPIDINSDDKAVLDDEPVVNQGLAAALQLADKKGSLLRNFFFLNLQATKGGGTHPLRFFRCHTFGSGIKF